jgi:hypothetical protein
MDKFMPAASLLTKHDCQSNAANCTIVDASSLLYQPALRAAIVREQVALLATRLAVARWTSGSADLSATHADNAPTGRAAFYARAQEAFFGWIERGGVWEGHGTPGVHGPATQQNDGAEAVVHTAGLLHRSTPSEE